MTDPRQTARDSATSARSKVFGPALDIPTILRDRHEFGGQRPPPLNESLIGDIQRGPRPPSRPSPMHRPVTEVPVATWPHIPRPTLHGIGWLVQLVVGLLTLWLIAHGGHL